MKLMELLGQGKLATCEGLSQKYIWRNGGDILTDNGENFTLSYDLLAKNDWEEYKEYRYSFDIDDGGVYHTIMSNGGIVESLNKEGYLTEELKNFNLFPKRNIAEYIYKKQLLERKLITFSYLNGADKIDWGSITQRIYYIDLVTCNDGDYKEIKIDNSTTYRRIPLVHFSSKDVVNSAMKLYKTEIEEILELSKKFGF